MTTRTYRISHVAVQQLVEGDSVHETLLALASGHARLEVRGVGRVDGLRMTHAQPVRGEHLVLALTGAVEGEHVHLAIVARGPGGELVTGLLDEARAVELELSVTVLEHASPDLVSQKEPTLDKPPRIKSATTSTTSWADVAAASAKAQAESDAEEATEADAATPSLGDLIDHGTFGLCVVEKIDGDEEFVMVRTANKRLLRLSLDVLRLVRTGEEDGHTVFKARGKRA
ncbi:MAG: hypothetical protein ABI321_03125 [Polyangia bacterium]